MDFALIITEQVIANAAFDLLIQPPGILTGKALQTAVIISLFTDRRANRDDPLSLDESRRGWWADTYFESNDKIGSRLWLLRRAKMIQSTLVRAREYSLEGLRWMLDDNVAGRIEIETDFYNRFILALGVNIVRPTGGQNFNFQYVWNDA